MNLRCVALAAARGKGDHVISRPNTRPALTSSGRKALRLRSARLEEPAQEAGTLISQNALHQLHLVVQARMVQHLQN